MSLLPLNDPAGVSASIAIAEASDYFETIPNGSPASPDDVLALLVLAIQEVPEEDPNPRLVASRVQFDKLGFGSKAPELSSVERCSLYLLFYWRKTGNRLPGLADRVRDLGGDPSLQMRKMWGRVNSLWHRIVEARNSLEERCEQLRQELHDALPSGLSLMPHQLEGVLRARDSGFRIIFGDDMGLGKTIEILACALLMGSDAFPMLVSSPLSMVYKWRVEADKWLSKRDPLIVELTKKVNVRDLVKENKDRNIVFVGSWVQPSYHQMLFQHMDLGLVVGDESHYICNWDSARTRGFIMSRRRAKGVICASGTFLPNGRHKEAYSQLKAVDPNCLSYLICPDDSGDVPRGDRYPFLYRYCGPTLQHIGRYNKKNESVPVTQFNGRSHDVEFGCLLNRYVIRRTKVEVFGKDGLPPKSRFVVPVPISESTRMKFAKVRDQIAAKVQAKALELETHLRNHGVNEDVVKRKVKKITQSEAVRLIGALRVQIGIEKAKWSRIRIKELIQEGHRPVVFCWHNQVAQEAAELYRKQGHSVLLGTGQMTGAKRDQVVREAEAGSHDVVVLTSAYREGITLISYDWIVMLERWWKPGDEQQAEDRIHRIGQELPVGVDYLVAPKTYDEAIGKLQVWKEQGQVQSQGSAEERTYEWLMAA